MQTSAGRMATIEQVYATAGAMSAPVLIHVDGAVEWVNRSFIGRFGVNEEAVSAVRVKDLLWCLGVVEPVAGMIAEGVTFHHCEMPPLQEGDGTLYLRQSCLSLQIDGRRRMMLVLADEFDPDVEELTLGAN
jgi:hypothetical protein